MKKSERKQIGKANRKRINEHLRPGLKLNKAGRIEEVAARGAKEGKMDLA